MVTRIIGVGNVLRGDDGIASAVIALLANMSLPDQVEIFDAGQAGLALVGLLEGVDHVILIDAVDMARPPGDVVVFAPMDVLITPDQRGGNIHNARTETAIQMADALGCLPPCVNVVGVQPRQMGWGEGLSSEVELAVPRAAAVIQKLIFDQGVIHGQPNNSYCG